MNKKVAKAVSVLMRADKEIKPIMEKKDKVEDLRDAIYWAAKLTADEAKNSNEFNLKDNRYFVFDLTGIHEICSDVKCSYVYGVKFDSYDELTELIMNVSDEYPKKYFLFPYIRLSSGELAYSDQYLAELIGSNPFCENNLDEKLMVNDVGIRQYVVSIHFGKDCSEWNEEIHDMLDTSFYEMYPDLKPEEKAATD